MKKLNEYSERWTLNTHIKIVLYNNKNDDKHPQQWKKDGKS